MAACQTPNPPTQPGPQTNQAQPKTVMQNVPNHEHCHHNDNSGFGWGSLLLAGLAGIVIGGFIAEKMQPEPVVPEYYLQR